MAPGLLIDYMKIVAWNEDDIPRQVQVIDKEWNNMIFDNEMNHIVVDIEMLGVEVAEMIEVPDVVVVVGIFVVDDIEIDNEVDNVAAHIVVHNQRLVIDILRHFDHDDIHIEMLF